MHQQDPEERERLFNAHSEVPCIMQKAQWAMRVRACLNAFNQSRPGSIRLSLPYLGRSRSYTTLKPYPHTTPR